MIRFQCVSCNTTYTVDSKHVGKKAQCKSCNNINIVPATSAETFSKTPVVPKPVVKPVKHGPPHGGTKSVGIWIATGGIVLLLTLIVFAIVLYNLLPNSNVASTAPVETEEVPAKVEVAEVVPDAQQKKDEMQMAKNQTIILLRQIFDNIRGEKDPDKYGRGLLNIMEEVVDLAFDTQDETFLALTKSAMVHLACAQTYWEVFLAEIGPDRIKTPRLEELQNRIAREVVAAQRQIEILEVSAHSFK